MCIEQNATVRQVSIGLSWASFILSAFSGTMKAALVEAAFIRSEERRASCR